MFQDLTTAAFDNHDAILVAAAAFVAVIGSMSAFAFAVRAGLASPMRELVAGPLLGCSLWVTEALLLLSHSAEFPLGSMWFEPLATSFVVAVVGATVGVTLLARYDAEWLHALAGAVIGISAGAATHVLGTMMLVEPPHDFVATVIWAAVAMSTSATAGLLSRMSIGAVAIAGAGLVQAAALFVTHYWDAHAVASEQVGRADTFARDALALAILLVLAAGVAIATAGAVLMCRKLTSRSADAERQLAGERRLAASMDAEMRSSVAALSGCLDLMTAEALPLAQRSRLDTARAFTRDLESLLAGARTVSQLGGAPTAGATKRSAPTLSILVADDSEVHRTLAAEILRRAGAVVVTAGNGREALAAMRARPFDIVFMDLDMPVMDGVAATEAARRDERLGNTIIIGVSTDVAADRAEALEAGMDDVAAKPLSRERCAEVLAAWCDPPNAVASVDQNGPMSAAAPAPKPVFSAFGSRSTLGV
jgi:CheY-like chemotaxis protein